MVFNTLTVGAAVTPQVVGTTLSHYTDRKTRRHRPTAHIGYDLGLHLVRRFVEYSASHTVEEVQHFTAQWVPAPRWLVTENVVIPQANMDSAAAHLVKQLGPDGIKQVGGKEWWRWRRDNKPLKAEWIEMRKDFNARKAANDKGSRVMLYVHGGAYYFGSVDEHRYQIQRHARKLKARCLAPRYRLAPQFPFPCGLYDALASYLFLLDQYDPSSILVAGDSAGGGMVLSMLVILRDQGIPLPAGGMLLSPWVDLMHSFPSIAGDGAFDYIPSNGFIHKPSVSWPPPTVEPEQTMPTGVAAAGDIVNPDEEEEMKENMADLGIVSEGQTATQEEIQGFAEIPANSSHEAAKKVKPGVEGHSAPSIMIDGKIVQILDQIQMYAPNHLLTHPLVSPVLQPSLGGLPPLLIQVGGGEMLRDEQIYLGHKLAHPARYPPSEEILNRYDSDRTQLQKWKPTYVQLQVWEDLCHVGHTLSWTGPAKYMYRSVAQFGAWALAHAQDRAIDIIDEGHESDSDDFSSEEDNGASATSPNQSLPTAVANEPLSTQATANTPSIGMAGDPLPPFKNYMIRQRIDRHGRVFALAPPTELAALQLDPSEIGVLKEVPVKKWMARQTEWNRKFAHAKRQLQKERAKQIVADGYVGLPAGEKPPPTALAGRRESDMPKQQKKTRSMGMSWWTKWGSKHDETTIDTTAKQESDAADAANGTLDKDAEKKASRSRSRSRSRPMITHSVTDQGQADGQHIGATAGSSNVSQDPTGHLAPPFTTTNTTIPTTTAAAAETETTGTVIGETLIPPTDTSSTRPTHNGIAYPFKLSVPAHLRQKSANPSLITLKSEEGSRVGTPVEGSFARGFEGLGGDGEGRVERPGLGERFETAREVL